MKTLKTATPTNRTEVELSREFAALTDLRVGRNCRLSNGNVARVEELRLNDFGQLTARVLVALDKSRETVFVNDQIRPL